MSRVLPSRPGRAFPTKEELSNQSPASSKTTPANSKSASVASPATSKLSQGNKHDTEIPIYPRKREYKCKYIYHTISIFCFVNLHLSNKNLL